MILWKAVAVVGGWHDDLDQSALVEYGAGEELIGAVSQGGDTLNVRGGEIQQHQRPLLAVSRSHQRGI